MLAILLALPACSPEQSAYQERMKAWTADQERRTDQITAELAALRNMLERPQPMLREYPWQIIEAKAAHKEGIFLIDRSAGDTWLLHSTSNQLGWYPIEIYIKRGGINFDWLESGQVTSPTNQPHTTR